MRADSTTPSISLPSAQFYEWRGYRCAYALHPQPDSTAPPGIPLLLVHPVGVGLSRSFWHRFCREWHRQGANNPIYNPDLLGCGESDMPHVAYSERDWAEQLDYFVREIVGQPTLVVAQGAEIAIALALVERQTAASNVLRGIVSAGPPPWALMTEAIPSWQQKLAWNLLDSPLGGAFYRYARRRQFLRSFSQRQLFAAPGKVDEEWLDMLEKGAADAANRYAVFSFLAGFWRRDYKPIIAATPQPTLIVMGEQASSISRTGQSETPEDRMVEYVKHLPQGQARQIPGRNVLPYEATSEFVGVVAEFASQLANGM